MPLDSPISMLYLITGSSLRPRQSWKFLTYIPTHDFDFYLSPKPMRNSPFRGQYYYFARDLDLMVHEGFRYLAWTLLQ